MEARARVRLLVTEMLQGTAQRGCASIAPFAPYDIADFRDLDEAAAIRASTVLIAEVLLVRPCGGAKVSGGSNRQTTQAKIVSCCRPPCRSARRSHCAAAVLPLPGCRLDNGRLRNRPRRSCARCRRRRRLRS